jgi:CelD/BcsL family acetyltransferase involved in cellulose biosynthesis
MYTSQVIYPKKMLDLGSDAAVHNPASASSDEVSARLHEIGASELEGLIPEWQTFAAEQQSQVPFFQPYWFKTFAKTFAGGKPFPIVVTRSGKNVRGILPLMRQSNFLKYIPAKTLGSLSGLHSCRFDLVCSAGERERVSLAVWNCLKDYSQWSALEVRTVPSDGAFMSVIRHAEQDGFLTAWWPTLISPYLTLPQQGREPFENCPLKYQSDRKRLKKYEGRLREAGAVSFKVHDTFSEDLFSNFLRLEGAGWKGRAGGAIQCSPVVTQFYREVLQAASQHGHLRMCTLEAGNKLVAMEMAFVVGGACFSPKIAYDEGYARCSPGQILASYAIRDLVERGVAVYDLLGGRGRHKSLWAGEERLHGTALIFRPTVRGRAYHAVAAKVAPYAKRIKHYLYGDPQGKR